MTVGFFSFIMLPYGDFGDWNEIGVTYTDPPRGYKPPSVSTSDKGADELARIAWRPVTSAARYIVTRQGPNDAASVTLTTAERPGHHSRTWT